MHILELPSIFFPRGGGFCLDQAKALAQHGHEVRILACVELGVTETPSDYLTCPLQAHWTEYDGIATYQYFARRVPKCIRLNNQLWLKRVVKLMSDYIEAHGKPDLIHAHSVHWAGYAAMLIADRWHVPYVITEHSSRAIFEMEFGKGNTDCWQIPLLKMALKRAMRVIPVADELVANLAPLLGCDYSYTVIPNTIDTSYFAPRQRQRHPGFRFVYPAVFFPLKAHDVLFEAIRLLRVRLADVELHLAGSGTDSPAMRRLIGSYGVARQVHLHGKLDKAEIRQLYYDCDCLVVPSRSEAQPLICLEAAATGIPFVGTEVIPQSLRLPDCPIVPTDDAQALADAMYGMATSYHDHDWTHLPDKAAELASPQAFALRFEQMLR